jgi:hypothetical protein
MQSAPLKALALSCALCALAACSRGAVPGQSGAATTSTASTPAAQTSAETGEDSASRNPCDVITAADVAGILLTPATRKDLPPGSCMYETQTHGQVVFNVARGDNGRGLWTMMTGPQGATIPLSGVGDQALYNAGGTAFFARNGGEVCFLSVVGYDNSDAMDSITKDRGEALARKLGALCTKLFAAR